MDMHLILAITGISMAVSGTYCFRKNGGGAGDPSPAKPDKDGIRRVPLAKASKLWTEPRQIPLAEVSVIWVDPPKAKKPFARPQFEHEDLAIFWDEVVAPRININRQATEAIITLLKILDEDGECPSVVRNPIFREEHENKIGKDEFDMLSKITLLTHTLSVARNMAMRMGREILVPDALIVSLGHDLGKIPTYHNKGYTTGDHPIISAIVLLGLDNFKSLPNHNELAQIVRCHHHLKPADHISVMLKECDQITRQKEFAEKMFVAVEAEKLAGQDHAKVSETATIPYDDLPQPESDPDTAPDHHMGFGPDKSVLGLSRIEIPWFEPDKFLLSLKGWINYMDDSRWAAISMPDGTVYVVNVTVWKILRKIAPREIQADLAAAELDEAKKRKILYSVVWTLSEQRNAIAAEMLKSDYYMVPVIVLSAAGKPVPDHPMLIPFRAEAFGALPSELEKSKSPKLIAKVKTIKPRMEKK
jgi:hypothetical protein